jgi:[acyl-carrier-protein] S-malonyltransferase
MFPGQSSASPRAVQRAMAAHPAAASVTDSARRVLGPRAARYLSPAGVMLESNRDVQVSVFLATQMYLAALEDEGVTGDRSLGLSLGEYSHLVQIGALDRDDALALVDERGRCYDEAPPGVMVTVLAVDHDTVAAVVAEARQHGPIVISNYNAPTQHVIAGAEAAVTWAATRLEDDHGAHTTVIERRVPMHSPLMQPVAERFRGVLAQAAWQPARRPYHPNVLGRTIGNASPHALVDHLTRHVSEPVRWQASIETLAADCPSATFVEVGPGGVLHNMLGRAWRSLKRARVDGPEELAPAAHFAATMETLRA